MQGRRIRTAANNGGITPGQRAVFEEPVLDGRLDLVLSSSGAGSLHAFNVGLRRNLHAALQHSLLVRRLDAT